jgi:hypothetical protein
MACASIDPQDSKQCKAPKMISSYRLVSTILPLITNMYRLISVVIVFTQETFHPWGFMEA